MSQPTYQSVPVAQLRPNPWNTNIVPPDNEAKLEQSMRRNGVFRPIIAREIDENGTTVLEIIGGEHRWGLAKKIGLAEVPVVNMGPITDLQAKEIGVIDNTRYGADDALSFAELLKSLGDVDELQSFLPYAEEQFKDIFSVSDIALDDLEFAQDDEIVDAPEPAAAKAPKTHSMLRFKVPLQDAERISALIGRTQKQHGLNTADELTNAGDALVHLLVTQFTAASDADAEELDELEALLDQATSE